MLITHCRCKGDCFNRDSTGQCHLLNDTSNYKGHCPFMKSGEVMLKELLECAERVGIKPNLYRMILKSEVFDKVQYKNIFEGGETNAE